MTMLREGATSRLQALHDAMDKVQPLANYEGNISAIHAALVMLKAMDAVREDFSFLVEEAK